MSKYTTQLETHVSPAAQQHIDDWLTKQKYAEYRDELVAMIEGERWDALEDAFFKTLEFGTAGRRGTTGVGSNRINRVTIGESAQALCEYATQFDSSAATKGVVIAYDTRITSVELSRYTAQVCAANGYTVYLFEGYRSTPELSFAVRHLKTALGIVISASHNPPADNGFKAYWSDGGQIASPHDTGVLALAKNIDVIHEISFDEAISQGRIHMISNDVDSAYIDRVARESLGTDRDIRIAYSPLHGAGQTNVLPVLRKVGFADIVCVDEQMIPDGNFPSLPSGKPNPEEVEANDMVVRKMHESSADIAISNDPDADRVGVMVPSGVDTKYLSGNQAAILAADYSLRRLREQGVLTPRHFIVKTIVTTDMLADIAAHYGVSCYGDLMIGFKYISQAINQHQEQGETFVIGCEESFGMLKGDYARDKDGASGALMLAECAADLKRSGKTLIDRLHELYSQHGLYRERLDTIVCPGASGHRAMQDIMDTLRTTPPLRIGGVEVHYMHDFLSATRKDLRTGDDAPLDVQSSNMVMFDCGDGRSILVRPSGTEPKIKLYIKWRKDVSGDVASAIDDLDGELTNLATELHEILRIDGS